MKEINKVGLTYKKKTLPFLYLNLLLSKKLDKKSPRLSSRAHLIY